MGRIEERQPAHQGGRGGCEVFLTADQNLPNQQKVAVYQIAIIALRSPINDITDLRKLVPALLVRLPLARKASARVIEEKALSCYALAIATVK